MISRQFMNKPKLYIHIFPSTEFDWDSLKLDSEKKVLYVRHLFEFHSSHQVQGVPKFWCFKSDRIFLNSCPSDVYETVSDKIFEEICSGVDNVVMSYGQNYSGKTFTLSGLENQFDLRGIVPRFVSELFGNKKIKDGISTEVWMSNVDIDGIFMHDLLSTPVNKCKSSTEVQRIKVKSELHCFELLFKGEARRENIRQMSYRSHVNSNVVTFIIRLTTLNYQDPRDKFSKVHFVDLAGVETIHRNPMTSFKNLKNQSNANVTKSLLEVLALSFQKQKIFKSSVSQRLHKLTEYLGNSFSPKSYIKLICHIRPHHQDIMITLSALKFGMTFKNMSMLKPEVHSELNSDRVIESLRNQVKVLQDELLIRDLGSVKSSMKISQDRIPFVRRAVESFLKNELSENELYSMVGDCSVILNVMRSYEHDRQSKERKDIWSQTDEIEFEHQPAESSIRKSAKITSPRPSIVKENTTTTPSTKHVSFSSKEPKKKDKGRKSKTDGSVKSKGKEKLVLVSSEVQVNLIEPDATLPQIDTREYMWAQFMITHPEIEQELHSFEYIVSNKQNKLSTAAAKLEEFDSAMERVKLSLLQLTTDEALYKKANDEEKMLIHEEKTFLLNELKSIQQEMEVSEQQVTDAKIEWLESVEGLIKAKQIIEQVFQQFCKINNLLPLYSEDPSTNETDIVEIKSTSQMQNSDKLKEYFSRLQNKYLHNNFI